MSSGAGIIGLGFPSPPCPPVLLHHPSPTSRPGLSVSPCSCPSNPSPLYQVPPSNGPPGVFLIQVALVLLVSMLLVTLAHVVFVTLV